MRKAQVITQVVVFVIAAFVFLLVLIYGYRAIQNLMEKQEQVSLIEMQRSAEAVFGRVTQNYGSVERFDFHVPAGFSELCIASSRDQALQGIPGMRSERPFLYETWLTGSANIFLEPSGPAFLIEKVKVKNGYCCLEADGRVSLRLEGEGKDVLIRPWEGACIP